MAIRPNFAGVVLAVLLATTALPVMAEELQVRSGVVIAIQPAMVKAAKPAVLSRREKRELGGWLGYVVGQATGGNGADAYLLGRVASDLSGEIAKGDTDSTKAGSYTFMVRFDDASESAFTKSREHLDHILVGSRVRVVGAGTSAALLPE
ncbi:hypothetical protein WCE34_05965 [Luteimonas sp. MJ204]|uniref:hypothetical protein n=1 Tax=Luteimonas sp. MJ145 TaxID=3129234 RepID=UPI0031BAC61D